MWGGLVESSGESELIRRNDINVACERCDKDLVNVPMYLVASFVKSWEFEGRATMYVSFFIYRLHSFHCCLCCVFALELQEM